nr:hypothetical protein [Tanacetum cinerariifolium]
MSQSPLRELREAFNSTNLSMMWTVMMDTKEQQAKDLNVINDLLLKISETQLRTFDKHELLAMLKYSRFGSLSHLKDVIVGGLKIQKLYQEHLDLIQPHYSDEDISNDFVVEDELRLCLEDEEKMLLEREKNIIKEQRFRVEEAKRG